MKDIHGIISLDDEKFSLGAQIKLYEKQSGELIAQVISDHEGRFLFMQISPGDYMVVAYPPGTNNDAQVKHFTVQE